VPTPKLLYPILLLYVPEKFTEPIFKYPFNVLYCADVILVFNPEFIIILPAPVKFCAELTNPILIVFVAVVISVDVPNPILFDPVEFFRHI